METNFCENILETFNLIISKNAYTRKKIAEKLDNNIRSVTKYIAFLKDKLNVDVAWSRKGKRYIGIVKINQMYF